MLDETTITLTNLTLDDHMNIQCNATNIHGYVFADVYLNVLGMLRYLSIFRAKLFLKSIH